MLSFAYPWMLIFLPVPWLVYRFVPPREIRREAVRVPFGDRLAESISSTGPTPQVNRLRKFILPSILWLLVLTAMARPQWIEPPIIMEIPTRDLLLLVDLSSSMDQKDFVNSAGKSVTRLEAVKEVLGTFLEKRKGDRVGLVVFGDAAYVQAPFSTDLSIARRLLDECDVGMAGPRTALGDAIGLGVTLFEKSETPSKTMIALTDGNDTASQVPPLEASRVAAQRDIVIHCVAIGDPTTAGEDRLDEQALKDVARASKGTYFFAGDRQKLDSIYDELDKIETHQVESISHRPKRDLYYYFVMAGLAISLIEKFNISFRFFSARQPTSPTT